jgi:TraY domain
VWSRLAPFATVCYCFDMTNKRKRAPGGGRKPKGPIGGNASWFQARITEDLRVSLERAAAENGRSLSQEAQVRLKESFDLPAELQKAWGPPEVKELAQLVSRVVRSVQTSVGADPFETAGDLAWHRNPFTHAAVRTAIETLLAHHKPEGSFGIPPEVKKRAQFVDPEHADAMTTPESVGLSCAFGLLSQIATASPPRFPPPANAQYAEGFYTFPNIRRVLDKEPKK